MGRQDGFTLIELVMFIAISSMLIVGLWLSFATSLKQMDVVLQNNIATHTVMECAELYLASRRVNGYSNITCTSPMSVSTLCFLPAGYSISGDCVQTTLRGDPNYETLSFDVSGPGSANLTFLIGTY